MSLFLYSTNCWLSFAISEKYYDGEHFVWCADTFDPALKKDPGGRSAPPTSSPREILAALAKEVHAGDRHSSKVANLRQALIRGAKIRCSNGEIDTAAVSEIEYIVESAEIRDFAPLLYIIDRSKVRDRLQRVAPVDRAHPLSDEYQIERLARFEFEVIDIFGPLG